jgi:hypothetical protein
MFYQYNVPDGTEKMIMEMNSHTLFDLKKN